MCTIDAAKLGQTVAHYPPLLLVFIARLYLPICTLPGKVPYLTTPIRPLYPAKSGIMTREEKKRSYPQSDRFNRHSWLDSMWERDASNIRGDCCRESCPLFRVLRHRTPSSPIYLSEEIHKPFALSRVFLLSCGGKSIVLVKKKAPSRSGFPLSMYVVLKTRHANPNIHARRY